MLNKLLLTILALEITLLFSLIPFPGPKSGNQSLDESIKMASQWYLNDANPDTGLLNYQYDPIGDTYSTKNNHIRQLASLWTLTELKKYTGDKNLEKLIDKNFDYYLGYKAQKENYSYLKIDEPKIAYNAFIIMALINSPSPEYDELAKEFGDGIVTVQRENGSYSTDFEKDSDDGVQYYPGEAMLALMKLYEATDDKRYLESVKKAFPYYREYWHENKNTAMVPWHTQVYYLLYQHTKDESIPPYVFEMNDWIIDNFQLLTCPDIEKIGGFPKNDPRNLTGFVLEGLVDAYKLADEIAIKAEAEGPEDDPSRFEQSRRKKYKNSVELARDFVLRSQYIKSDTFSRFKNSRRVIGGFKASIKDPRVRIDYTQHAVMALIKLQRLSKQ